MNLHVSSQRPNLCVISLLIVYWHSFSSFLIYQQLIIILVFKVKNKYKLPSSKRGFVEGEEGMANYCGFVCQCLAKENPLFPSSQNLAFIWPVHLYFRATPSSKIR